MAHDLIVQKKVDFVVLGRAFIADPEFLAKTRAGQLDEIRPCLAECRGCADEHIQRGGLTTCVVNPRMSREFDLIDVEGAAQSPPKHVLVLAEGLAALQAARWAAFSGHRVALCERGDRLGGQLLLAAKMPARSELADILPWYIRQLNKYGVDVRLSVDVDRALIEQMKVDTVIVATGSSPEVPQHLINIVMNVANIKVLMLDEMIRDDSFTGAKVLVIGGNQNGVLASDWLAEPGAEVWVAEAHGHFGEKLARHDRWALLNRPAKKSVHRLKIVR